MEYKSFKVDRVKALGDGESDGTFEAIVSVFGNVDSYGDRVESGAFATTLQKGFPAVVWTHQWTEPPIGATLDAKETSEGLYVKGRLFIEDNQRAREVYAAMKNLGGDGQPPLREFSFAYDIVNAGWEVVDEEEIFSLKELELIEVGPCLRGANDQTRLIGVKSDGADGRERPPKPSESGEKTSPDPEAVRAAKARVADLLTARPE